MTAQFLGVCPCAISISDKAVAGQEAASLYQAGIQNLQKSPLALTKRSRSERETFESQPSQTDVPTFTRY